MGNDTYIFFHIENLLRKQPLILCPSYWEFKAQPFCAFTTIPFKAFLLKFLRWKTIICLINSSPIAYSTWLWHLPWALFAPRIDFTIPKSFPFLGRNQFVISLPTLQFPSQIEIFWGENMLRCTTKDEKGLVLNAVLFPPYILIPIKTNGLKRSNVSQLPYFKPLQF